MGFTGQGLYEVVPYLAPALSARSMATGTESGAAIKTATRNKDNPDPTALWYFVLFAGSGDSADYLIFNLRSASMLTAPADKSITTTTQGTMTDPTKQWTITSSPSNGNDTFTINSKTPSRGQLNVSGHSTQSGAEILSWPIENGDNTKWYLYPAQFPSS